MKYCSVCNKIFDCTDSYDCWCMDVVKFKEPKISEGDCMCEDCLLKEYQQRLMNK